MRQRQFSLNVWTSALIGAGSSMTAALAGLPFCASSFTAQLLPSPVVPRTHPSAAGPVPSAGTRRAGLAPTRQDGSVCATVLPATLVLFAASVRRRERQLARRAASAADSDEPQESSDAGASQKATPPGSGAAGKKQVFNPSTEPGVTEPFGFFDPLGLAPKDKTVFFEYRACEIKHGRVAMMAAVGSIVQHYVRFPGFDRTTYGEPMPAGFAAINSNPATFGFVVLTLLAGIVELAFWRDDIEKGAGNYGDPLGLDNYNYDMRNREINNGRMAMFSIAGIIAAELVTGKDAVQQLGLA